jgi:HlyD family secretion protein
MGDREKVDVGKVLAVDAKVRRRRRIVKFVLVPLVLIAAGAVVLVLKLRGGDDGPHYRTEVLERGDLQISVTATGTVQARNTVDVGAEVTGRLVEVAVDFNDRLEPGQVLARIDPVPFALDVSQARARVLSARAALASARATAAETARQRDRQEALAREGLVSRQDLDAIRTAATRSAADIDSARARLAEAEAALEASSSRLEKTTIRSPIAGIVLDRKVENGQTVTAGFQTPVLFSLATDLAEMELRASVDEADVGRVEEGQDARFVVDAHSGRVFESRVLSIRNVPRLEQNVVTYEAILSVDNDDRALRPGMTATATITTTKVEDALLVPNAALRFRPPQDEQVAAGGSGGPRLPFLMGPPRGPQGGAGRDRKADKDPTVGTIHVLQNGQPVARRIRRGDTDGDHTVVLEGEVSAGDEVILDTAALPKAGG